MGRGKPSRRQRYRLVLCGFAAAGVAAAMLLGQTAFFQLLHLKTRDLHFCLTRLPSHHRRRADRHRPEIARHVSRTAALLASLLCGGHSRRGGGRSQGVRARRHLRDPGGQMGARSRPRPRGRGDRKPAAHAGDLPLHSGNAGVERSGVRAVEHARRKHGAGGARESRCGPRRLRARGAAGRAGGAAAP